MVPLFSAPGPQPPQFRSAVCDPAIFLTTGLARALNHTVGHTKDGLDSMAGGDWNGTLIESHRPDLASGTS